MVRIIFALAGLTMLGVVLTSIQTYLTWRLTRRRRPFGQGRREQAGLFAPNGFPPGDSTIPRVSILKPLCGVDDELLDNLRSFVRLPGVSYEVILSVADPNDPAVGIAQTIMGQFPFAPFRLVIGEVPGVANPKVERLIAAMRHARGDIILISDSNVRVRRYDLASTVAAFQDDTVGCVSNPFVGEGAMSFGATIEALHLMTFVAPGCALAAAAGVSCVVGKSMAIRRDVLEKIGGFEAFREILAEDQAIGLAVQRSGYRVVLSPIVVRNVVIRRKLRRALARQVRWNKIRYSFSKALYTSEFLLNPLPFALLTLQPWLIGSVLVLRVLQTLLLARAAGASLTIGQMLLTPVKDLLQFAVQFVPFFSNQIDWQGHRARLGHGTVMLPLDDLAAA